ncbi:MAG TPA: hypothetical protein VKU41_01705, partial [Polyangiaceae bacterium]|nr:hypothetical protein [Polyangiaceae bacterium]
ITQKSKDHTLAASKQRIGLMTAKRAKAHPDRSVLTRSMGRELIVALDQISFPLEADDRLLLCSDGLYNVLDDDELLAALREGTPEAASESLVSTANARGTPDNLTAAVVHVTGVPPDSALRDGWRGRIARMLGR